MFAPIYLDYNATAPVDPVVREAMQPYLDTRFGNASSRHEYGRAARRAIDTAREQIAAAVGAHPTEVLLTSGGSEANNLFLKGALWARGKGGLAVSTIEHPCVLRPAEWMGRQGCALVLLPANADGVVTVEALQPALAETPVLVSVMAANNETGALQPVAELARAARDAGALFHCDAVQALGRIALDFRALAVHGLTISAHKIGGPKGAGALVVDKSVELTPLIHGGGHERGLRSGTENVAAIVGFGAACELAVGRQAREAERQQVLRAQVDAGVQALGAQLFAGRVARLPNTSCFAFAGVDGETLVGQLDREGYACASGAACSSASPGASHVLLAMGVAEDVARGAVRVSLGVATTGEQIEGFLAALARIVGRLKGLAAVAA